MIELDENEAAVLTQVTCFPNLTQNRRLQLLKGYSERVKVIGKIIIKGEKSTDTSENRKIARKFIKWASQNER